MTQEPIDWYNPQYEFKYRHTPVAWMTWFNRTKADHERKQFNFWKSGHDTHALWQLNHERLPSWWRWHDEQFTYTYNSDGFRNDNEFNSINWSNSHVLFGSSAISCDGVPQSESILHYMQQLINRDVVCIGVGGCSHEVVFNNVVKMITEYGVPRGVHIIWPERIRQLDNLQLIVDDHGPTWLRKDIGPWNADQHHVKDATPFYRRNLYQHTVKQLLKGAYYSEIFESYLDVVPGPVGHRTHKLRLEISTPFPDHVLPDVTDLPWQHWCETSREWYFNNFLARDVYEDYDGVRNPRDWTHWGRFVNSAVADYFIRTQHKL